MSEYWGKHFLGGPMSMRIRFKRFLTGSKRIPRMSAAEREGAQFASFMGYLDGGNRFHLEAPTFSTPEGDQLK